MGAAAVAWIGDVPLPKRMPFAVSVAVPVPPLAILRLLAKNVLLLRSAAPLLSTPDALLCTSPAPRLPCVTTPVPVVNAPLPVTLVGPFRLTWPEPVSKVPTPVMAKLPLDWA